MKRRIMAVLLTGIMVVFTITGCSDVTVRIDTDPDKPVKEGALKGDETGEAEEAEPDYRQFKSDRGWAVEYDASVINVEDNTDPADEVSFIYTGECGGTCMVVASYAEGRLPDEILEDLKDIQEKDTGIEISGGFFPGTTDRWAYWFTPTYAEEGSGYHEDYILGEYNGGTLSFQFITHSAGDDEIDMAVSDALAMIVDSLKFDDFKPQTMYDGIPGTYTRTVKEEIEGEEIETEYTLSLADDHTGVLSLQDDVDIIWDDRMLMAADGSFQYFITIKDDKITVDYDGEKLKFTRAEEKGKRKDMDKSMKKSSDRENLKLYEDQIEYEAPEGAYIAFVDINNGKKGEDALLIAPKEYVFEDSEGGKLATEATVYGFDEDGRIKEYGYVTSGGTANPLSVGDGCLYYGNHRELSRVYIDIEKSNLEVEKDRDFDELEDAVEVSFMPAR